MKTLLFILSFSISAIAANFDVLTYQHVPNPNGIPTNWPARVEGAAGRSAPWIQMTKEQLELHKATYEATYNAWKVEFETTQANIQQNNKMKEQILSDPLWDIVLKALGRLISNELSLIKTNAPKTAEQIETSLKENINTVLSEKYPTEEKKR